MHGESVLEMPFVWPDPHFHLGVVRNDASLPLEAAMGAAHCIFGVVSAVDAFALRWLEDYLAVNQQVRLRLVVSIYPTCRTTRGDLEGLKELVKMFRERVDFKVFPEGSLRDRSSNLLCVYRDDGENAVLVGPSENFGFSPMGPSQANLATIVSAATFEVCRKWFDCLWSLSGPIRPEVVSMLPNLVLPEGEPEAAQLWEVYRRRCLEPEGEEKNGIQAKIDPETGEVVITDAEGKTLPSPTENIGVKALDTLADAVARIYGRGLLASIDKLSRVPPFEAPVKPEWFGVDSFRQTGVVTAQTAIKVAPFDKITLGKIDRLRKVSSDLLPRYSFALADGIRWIPKLAIPQFESALAEAELEAKQMLTDALGDGVDAFLKSQLQRIREDAQRMYAGYHPGTTIPESAVTNILNELHHRLERAVSGKLVPRIAYSPLAFSLSHESEWSSPWGQAFSLLKGIAELPRQAMTDRFFFRGFRGKEDDLIEAMDVVGDPLVKDFGSRIACQRAEAELLLIRSVEQAPVEPKEKCRAILALITKGNQEVARTLMEASDVKPR